MNDKLKKLIIEHLGLDPDQIGELVIIDDETRGQSAYDGALLGLREVWGFLDKVPFEGAKEAVADIAEHVKTCPTCSKNIKLQEQAVFLGRMLVHAEALYGVQEEYRKWGEKTLNEQKDGSPDNITGNVHNEHGTKQ